MTSILDDDVLDDLDRADPSGTGQYFPVITAKYILQLKRAVLKRGFKGTSFRLEWQVIAVRTAEEGAPQAGEGRNHVWKADGDKKEIGRNTWMQFLCAAFGVANVKQYDAATWKKIAREVLNGALNGKFFVAETFPAAIQSGANAGKYRCHHQYLRQVTKDDLIEFGFAA